MSDSTTWPISKEQWDEKNRKDTNTQRMMIIVREPRGSAGLWCVYDVTTDSHNNAKNQMGNKIDGAPVFLSNKDVVLFWIQQLFFFFFSFGFWSVLIHYGYSCVVLARCVLPAAQVSERQIWRRNSSQGRCRKTRKTAHHHQLSQTMLLFMTKSLLIQKNEKKRISSMYMYIEVNKIRKR